MILDGEFVKIAVAGPHKNFIAFFRTFCSTEANVVNDWTEYNSFVLFKSLRNVKPISHFGRQVNKTKFIRDWYKKIRLHASGLFLVDSDSKTSDS